jgi:hypothetical protein
MQFHGRERLISETLTLSLRGFSRALSKQGHPHDQEGRATISRVMLPEMADYGQCGSGRGIPCGCPVATGLRAGHPGTGRHETCPYKSCACNAKTIK